MGVELKRRKGRSCGGGGDVKTHLPTLQSGQGAGAAATVAAAGDPTALWVEEFCRELRLIEQGCAVAQSVVVFGRQLQLIASFQQRRLENPWGGGEEWGGAPAGDCRMVVAVGGGSVARVTRLKKWPTLGEQSVYLLLRLNPALASQQQLILFSAFGGSCCPLLAPPPSPPTPFPGFSQVCSDRLLPPAAAAADSKESTS